MNRNNCDDQAQEERGATPAATSAQYNNSTASSTKASFNRHRHKNHQRSHKMAASTKRKVSMKDFEILKVLGTGAYGKVCLFESILQCNIIAFRNLLFCCAVLTRYLFSQVFLVRKIGGSDHRKLYAMKVLKKSSIVLKQKTLEHTKTERQVLEFIRRSSFLVSVHYAFQTPTKLHLILGLFLLLNF